MYDDTPDWDRFKENCDTLQEQIEKGRVYSAYVVDQGGIPEAVTKNGPSAIILVLNSINMPNEVFSNLLLVHLS